MKKNNLSRSNPDFWGLVLMAGLAVLARLAIAFCGYNYDTASFYLVGELCWDNQNIYEATSRYNYGCLWFFCLAAIKGFNVLMNWDSILAFHLSMAGFLSVVDVFLGLLLYKRHGKGAFLWFICAPLGALLTGFHSQMDNIAVLLAYCGYISLQQQPQRYLLAAFCLGLSLIQKHIFIVFPLWLAASDLLGSWRAKLGFVCCSYGLFLVSFLPFAYNAEAAAGIWHNVFLYRSFDKINSYHAAAQRLLPAQLSAFLLTYKLYTVGFLSALTVLGWYVRTRADAFYLYLLAVVAFSSALVNQYLAIPLLAVAVARNFWAALYILFASLFLLLKSPANIGLLQAYPLPAFINGLLSIYFLQLWLLSWLLHWLFFDSNIKRRG